MVKIIRDVARSLCINSFRVSFDNSPSSFGLVIILQSRFMIYESSDIIAFDRSKLPRSCHCLLAPSSSQVSESSSLEFTTLSVYQQQVESYEVV